MHILGIDVGGSGIKGAVVDTRTGKMVTSRLRLSTPEPSTPKSMARVVGRLVKHFDWQGRVGCGMPGPVIDGRIMTAINLHKSWVGVNAPELYSDVTGCRVAVINDADAAGLAEMKFGSGKGHKGVVVILTLGTGIGSALFVNGRLVPNMEFGQVNIRGKTAEKRASARVRKAKGLSWEKWGKALNEYLLELENLTWPDLFILGGGVSRKASKFLPMIETRAKVLPAALCNEAGIVGAALCAL